MKRYKLMFFMVLLLTGSFFSQPQGYSFSTKETRPKYIFLFISDGCGYNHIKACNYWQYGEAKRQVYEQFPVQFAMSTYPANGHGYDAEKAWTDRYYLKKKVTDSAASATAMATGIKTRNGAIGVDTLDSRLENIVERAERYGMSTGVVTSVQFTHATPAAFVAHNSKRSHYADIAKEMILKSQVDVIMGCGHPDYNQRGEAVDSSGKNYRYVGGRSTWELLLQGKAGNDANNDGSVDFWTLIQEKEDFEQLMVGSIPPRVIGLPKNHSTLQQERAGDSKADPFVVPFIDSVPSLETMTKAAIHVLENNEKGFFLLIEGGAVDWASHDNQFGRMIEEQIDFNKSIDATVAWIEKYSSWDETLLIVTGDHETGYLTGPDSDTGQGGDHVPITNPIKNMGKKNLPGMKWQSGSHTNSLIPFFAKGFGSDKFASMADEFDPIRGNYLDNTEIAKVLFELLEFAHTKKAQ